MSDETTFQDDGESFCEGDLPLEEVDWPLVERLQVMQDEIIATPGEANRNLLAVGLLDEMYGEDLVIL